MKRRLSSLLAGLLLTCFLVGGVAAPALHRVQHAEERADLRAEEAAFHAHHHVHDGPAAEGPHAAGQLQAFCFFCLRLVYRPVLPAAEAIAALRYEAPLRVRAPLVPAAPAHRRSVIRGPPALV